MKKYPLFLLAAVWIAGGLDAPAQSHQSGTVAASLNLNGGLTALFGRHQAFSATMIFESVQARRTNTLSGKFCYDAGKVRFETSLLEMMGSGNPPDVAAQIRSLGMDWSVTISRPDKKMTYILFPSLKTYVENSIPARSALPSPAEFKVKVQNIGKETVDGFETIKKEVMVTAKDGGKQKFRVWYAAKLGDFPIQIQTLEKTGGSIRHFRDVSLEKPAPDRFEIPADFTNNIELQTILPAR
jgi:hypothetical protein